MSTKFRSGHFSNTNGSTEVILEDIFGKADEPTATIWNHITPTQENYAATEIPKSFIVDTPQGNFWTHGNATKHMNELIRTLKGEAQIAQSNPNLLAQFVLYDYRKALIAATDKGIQYDKLYRSDNWEFKFSKRKSDRYTVVLHAVFKGFN